jgi:hypothetical protein
MKTKKEEIADKIAWYLTAGVLAGYITRQQVLELMQEWAEEYHRQQTEKDTVLRQPVVSGNSALGVAVCEKEGCNNEAVCNGKCGGHCDCPA